VVPRIVLVLGGLSALVCAQGVLGAPVVLKKQEGIFDTSMAPKRRYFEAKIEHKRFLNPEDDNVLLHGKGGVVDLRTQKNVLQGGVSENERLTTLTTREYGVQGLFKVDLRKLEAKFAPELSWYLDARAEAAKKKAFDDAVNAEREMERKRLAAERAKVQMPSVGAALNGAVQEASKALQTVVEQIKGTTAGVKIPTAGVPVAKIPDIAATHGVALHSSKERLAAGSVGIPVTKIPEAKIPVVGIPVAKIPEPWSAGAPPGTTSTSWSAGAHPGTTTTTVFPTRPLGTLPIGTIPIAVVPVARIPDAVVAVMRMPQAVDVESAKEPDEELIVEWDAWHKRFAQLAKTPLLKAVNQCGNPSGSNTLEITVSPDHHLNVKLSQPSNGKFDQAILQAYKSLDGNPSLEYPTGSKRTSITFLIDNKHTEAGVAGDVNSQTTTGDREVLRGRK
jgi:hypothetical protein